MVFTVGRVGTGTEDKHGTHPKVSVNVLEAKGIYGDLEGTALDSVLFNTCIKFID